MEPAEAAASPAGPQTERIYEQNTAAEGQAAGHQPIARVTVSAGGREPRPGEESPETSQHARPRPVVPLKEAEPPAAGQPEEAEEEPQEEEEPSGTLELRSNVPGAEVRLDGVLVGRTPATVRLKAGPRQTIELRADGYQPWTQKVSVGPNETAGLDVRLRPMRPTR